MRWICERFVKGGFRIVSVVYADDLFMAMLEYSEQTGNILTRRDMQMCDLFYGTFSMKDGQALVIRREPLQET